MPIKSIHSGRTQPVPAPSDSSNAAAPAAGLANASANTAAISANNVATPTTTTATASPGAKPALTARAIELRQAVAKNTPLLASLPHVVAPVLRADVDYLHMAATAAQEAQQARKQTDQMLDDYLSASLNATSTAEPALELQLWASIAFEFDHLETQVTALAGMQAANRGKLDQLQNARPDGPPEPAVTEHLQQAVELDQKLEKKRNEVELAIGYRDAVLEARLTRLGLLQPQ